MEPTKRNPRLMFLGTCRMHEPARVLRGGPDVDIRFAPPRLHSPRQILRFIEHITHEDQVSPETVHLVFDRAADRILSEGQSRAEFLASLENLHNVWKGINAFVIEISTFREFFATGADGDFLVNTFAERDQAKYASGIDAQAAAGLSVPCLPIRSEVLSAADAQAWIRKIKAAVGNRPVMWVSHMRPPGNDPRFAEVAATRLRLAHILHKIADELGDVFVDPSNAAEVMGQKVFFQNDGEDLNHLTVAAAERMAGIYKDFALGGTVSPVR